MNQEDKILFSIIIPTYNRAHLISKAIQSVLDQTYTHWELVIVDDGSTDNTEEVVRKFNDQRIRYFRKNHEERSVARNFGIEKSRGLYISFLDDDDYYLAEFLEEFSKIINDNKSSECIYMCSEYSVRNGKLVENKIPIQFIDNPIRLIWNYDPGIRPFVISKGILQKEIFSKEFYFGEDLHIVARIAIQSKTVIINTPLYCFVEHEMQSGHWKFNQNIKNNAYNSINCIKDIINNIPGLFQYIPKNEIYHKINHHVYGFASAAMKKSDFPLFFYLIKEFSFKGNKSILLYYFMSLLIRMPFYFFKSV